MKKILLIGNSCIVVHQAGGYSKQLYYLCKMFKEIGFNIYNFTFALTLHDGNDCTYLYNYYDLKQIIKNNFEITGINYECFDHDILKEIKYLTNHNHSSKADSDYRVNVDDINNIIKKHNIDYIFFLGDIFHFYENTKTDFIVRSFCWFTCHYYPISKMDYIGLKLFSNIICLSPSIKLIFEKEFPNKKISYLPHVAEKLNINLSKNEIRDKWNLPKSKIIILIVARIAGDIENRKSIDVNLIAFKKFNQKYKNSLLYFQQSSAEIQYEYPLEEIIFNLELSNEDIIINNEVISEEKLAELYKLSDIYLCNSKAEGFGVPIIEAQLYNTNVITTNFFSMKEHNFQKNIAEKSTEIINIPAESAWILPSSENIFNKMEEIYLNNNETKNKTSNWITTNLTSFNNIKKNLYKILMDT